MYKLSVRLNFPMGVTEIILNLTAWQYYCIYCIESLYRQNKKSEFIWKKKKKIVLGYIQIWYSDMVVVFFN